MRLGKLEDLVSMQKLSLISGEMKSLNSNVMMLIQSKCWYKFARSNLASS